MTLYTQLATENSGMTLWLKPNIRTSQQVKSWFPKLLVIILKQETSSCTRSTLNQAWKSVLISQTKQYTYTPNQISTTEKQWQNKYTVGQYFAYLTGKLKSVIEAWRQNIPTSKTLIL